MVQNAPNMAGPASSTLRKWVNLIAQESPGPILDVPSGYGRNAFLFAASGLQVYCVDKDPQAVSFIKAVQTTANLPGKLISVVADVNELPIRVSRMKFGAILIVDFVDLRLVRWAKEALLPGGFLYLETFANRGDNYLQLPNAGAVQKLLKGDVEYIVNAERHAGPPSSKSATLKLLARKLS